MSDLLNINENGKIELTELGEEFIQLFNSEECSPIINKYKKIAELRLKTPDLTPAETYIKDYRIKFRYHHLLQIERAITDLQKHNADVIAKLGEMISVVRGWIEDKNE